MRMQLVRVRLISEYKSKYSKCMSNFEAHHQTKAKISWILKMLLDIQCERGVAKRATPLIKCDHRTFIIALFGKTMRRKKSFNYKEQLTWVWSMESKKSTNVTIPNQKSMKRKWNLRELPLKLIMMKNRSQRKTRKLWMSRIMKLRRYNKNNFHMLLWSHPSLQVKTISRKIVSLFRRLKDQTSSQIIKKSKNRNKMILMAPSLNLCLSTKKRKHRFSKVIKWSNHLILIQSHKRPKIQSKELSINPWLKMPWTYLFVKSSLISLNLSILTRIILKMLYMVQLWFNKFRKNRSRLSNEQMTFWIIPLPRRKCFLKMIKWVNRQMLSAVRMLARNTLIASYNLECHLQRLLKHHWTRCLWANRASAHFHSEMLQKVILSAKNNHNAISNVFVASLMSKKLSQSKSTYAKNMINCLLLLFKVPILYQKIVTDILMMILCSKRSFKPLTKYFSMVQRTKFYL